MERSGSEGWPGRVQPVCQSAVKLVNVDLDGVLMRQCLPSPLPGVRSGRVLRLPRTLPCAEVARVRGDRATLVSGGGRTATRVQQPELWGVADGASLFVGCGGSCRSCGRMAEWATFTQIWLPEL